MRSLSKAALLLAAPALAAAQGLSPQEAEQRMKPLEGFSVNLVASEPEIRQPILVKFDERGRLWVIQYLQYPNPAGLKRVKVDRYSRTTYDRVPQPPPRGPRGADRITIVEDTDGDGRGDRFRDFVTGLNLATGLAIGHGGVFVLQVPYLLFYPDRNRDDIPDSDPEVLLTGFGMEDAQSLANHLTWGPDGWLYGLNGSTTTCRIRGIEFQQGVWRYHPVTREFELFAEGGGNIYGLTFDAAGRLFYSSNGSSLFWHAVQGAYYQKSFGKHGPLHNPYAYGHFPHVKHNGVPGGHVVLGGLIYSGESFPERFRESFIAGNFLGNSAAWWEVTPLGSTVEATLGGLLFDARDKWFCPTDLAQAPDGSIYVCDFHDERTAHPDPDAQWDRSNGRVYRVAYDSTKPIVGLDLKARSTAELVQLLRSRNRWYADQARVILAERRDPSSHPALRRMAEQTADAQLALQGIWGLAVSGGFDFAVAMRLLDHPAEHVRAWTVRLLGDRRQLSPALSRRLASLSRSEPSVLVRAQLAASAKRFAAAEALPVLEGIWQQDRDAADPHMPMLVWWALESKAIAARDAVLPLFARPAAWRSGLRRADQRRLIRRYAAEGAESTYEAAARLLAATPAEHEGSMLAALEQGLAERAGAAAVADAGVFERFAQDTAAGSAPPRSYKPVRGALRAAIEKVWRRKPEEPLHARLALRAEITGAAEGTLANALDRGKAPSTRAALLHVLAEVDSPLSGARLLPLLRDEEPDEVRAATLAAAGRSPDPSIAGVIVPKLAAWSPGLRDRALDHMLARASSTLDLLEAVDGGRLAPSAVPIDKLRRVASFNDARLDALVRKHWGNIGAGTPEEKLATVRRLNNDIRAGAADPASGQRAFLRHCGACHKLKGAGGDLGMDLTAANRSDRFYMLTHIVDPGVFIRKEYATVEVRTRDGRVLAGMIAAEDAGAVTLVDAAYRRTRISRADILSQNESNVSLMPDGILERLAPQELRDLFSYLETP
jgi:putative membrane-bound dehydrogenase-like protein